ncbi:hypothetical protein Emin_0738 [Elusimicrobium minutum Pei191]|uniref:Uncharacterized protein n=1 Tax=Elusimicrobium minutum (strain Pei191) TaxID=445932 RepID=B2KCP7_ELUMP|nr:hypothetical protein [Elusimicrobium minutum]ACC98293.1 hypothetical protein Emin_0738 [Elusimicrobium minutum Pei191]
MEKTWNVTFKAHFRRNFFTAFAFLLVWYVGAQTILTALEAPAKRIVSTSFAAWGMTLFAAFFITLFSYIFWIGAVLIYDSKFKLSDFVENFHKHYWFFISLLGLQLVYALVIQISFFSGDPGSDYFLITLIVTAVGALVALLRNLVIGVFFVGYETDVEMPNEIKTCFTQNLKPIAVFFILTIVISVIETFLTFFAQDMLVKYFISTPDAYAVKFTQLILGFISQALMLLALFVSMPFIKIKGKNI